MNAKKRTGITNTMLLASALLVAVLLAATTSTAQDPAAKEPLTIKLTLMRVEKDAEGKVKLVEATAVKPGDLVEYQAVYTNTGKEQLRNIQATLPIPQGLEYEAQSAQPRPFTASLDGKTFAAIPLMRTVQKKDGKSVSEPVPLSEYRALRWQIRTLAPGMDFIVKARARVSQQVMPPEPAKAPDAGAPKR